MSDDGPPLLRPTPRRPFDHNLTSATPPEDDSTPPSPGPDFNSARFLGAQYNGQSTASESGSLSRAQSILNLTASTLFGIYSPGTFGKDRFLNDRDESDTPWGTGAQTPIKRPSLDEPTYELMKDRSRLLRRHSSYPSTSTSPPPSTIVTLLSLTLRASLLFSLGMGYGVLVTHLHDGKNLTTFSVEGIIQPGYDWKYLTMWGFSGVVLGALLPWFDGVWENAFGNEVETVAQQVESPDKEPTDWALVVRSIGAFVGIVFAIRKLPWASTLQVSLTLALVNPFLWYLIDRSKPGFLLSVAVGLTGSAVLLSVNPGMMPTPSGSPYRNDSSRAFSDPTTFGGLVSQETIETGIWVLSVLFCSCVCFGNIGRRLSLSTTTTTRGRLGAAR